MKDLIDFLESYVNGRTVYTEELVYELENGALQGIYSDQISFCNLKYARNFFSLDMFVVSNEKIWIMEDTGRKQALRKDFSSVALFRYELAKRESTGAATGLFRFLSASGKDVAAEAVVSAIYDVRLGDGVLTLREEQALYRDQPVQDGRFKSVAFHSEHRFFERNGKLHYEYSGRSFDVDPCTMQRRPSYDSFPAFISIEK